MKIFVYGTLLKGQPNNYILPESATYKDAEVLGNLYTMTHRPSFPYLMSGLSFGAGSYIYKSDELLLEQDYNSLFKGREDFLDSIFEQNKSKIVKGQLVEFDVNSTTKRLAIGDVGNKEYIDVQVMSRLEILEGYDPDDVEHSHYRRSEIVVRTQSGYELAWVYRLTHPINGLIRIDSGSWIEFCKEYYDSRK